MICASTFFTNRALS